MAEVYSKPIRFRRPVGGYLLYALCAPLVPAIAVSVFRGDTRMLIAELAGLGLLLAGAWINRLGLKAAAEYERRKVAAAPPVPGKLIGGLLTGAGTAALSWMALGNTLMFSAIVGIAALAGCVLAYGADPRRDKVVAAQTSGYTTEEVLKALGDAENKIRAIEGAGAGLRNAELKARLRRIAGQARKILGVIEDDPRDLRRARKFLNVYLDGTRRVTEGYATAHKDNQAGELEDNFRNVLVTIEEVFGEQHQKLLENNAMDLDVQIEVLSTQLKREGVI